MRSIYCGFDPTADSLHIGSLVPLLALKRLQQHGHRPIALVGGATGLIGDPSFKADERQLNAADTVAGWVERLKPQLSRFLDFDCGDNSALLVNNLDWTADRDVLTFLRDVGKHFSVNAMIQKESVRQRIEREGAGISFTEFTYMILQAYDFAELYRRHGCTVQIGGSDQWGNITAGIDLTRRLHQSQVYGLTLPLVTRADGSKFGKTESGTVWLSPARTSPYAFYQFWINTADADVYNYLRYFSFRPPQEIANIEKEDKDTPDTPPKAQTILAQDVTELVHGEEGMKTVQRIGKALFSGDVKRLTEVDFVQMENDVPSTSLERIVGLLTTEDSVGLTGPNSKQAAVFKRLTASGITESIRQNPRDMGIVELLVISGLAPSNRQAREFVTNGAVQVNGERITDPAARFTPRQARFGRYLLLKRGKKQFHLMKLPD